MPDGVRLVLIVQGVWCISTLPTFACFTPHYDRPACGPEGECPVGMVCFETGCESPLIYTPSGEGAAVIGPGFDFRFASDSAFHFPDGLTIDNVNVLGHDVAAGCFNEDEVGILIAPTPRISAHGGAGPLANRLKATLGGPAVVQVILDWSTQFMCNSTRLPSGTTMFTVFPDGRIVRYDEITDPSQAEISANDCACDKSVTGSDAFTLSTYWTLTRKGFTDLVTNRGRESIPFPNGDAASNESIACLAGARTQIALAWSDPTSTSVKGGNNLIILDRDWLYRGSMLGSYALSNSSALFIEHHGCDAALMRASHYVAATQLLINREVVEPSQRDGIYGSVGNDGQPGVLLSRD